MQSRNEPTLEHNMSFTTALTCPTHLTNQDSCPCKHLTSGTSLWTLAEHGLAQVLATRLKNDNDLVDKQDTYGYSALHFAAGRGHVETCKILLEYGAKVDSRGCGATPLARAAAGRFPACVDTVKLLLEHGADPNAVDMSMFPYDAALHKACRAGHEGIVKLLLSYGARADMVNAEGHRAIDVLTTKNTLLFDSTTLKLLGHSTLTKQDDAERPTPPSSPPLPPLLPHAPDPSPIPLIPCARCGIPTLLLHRYQSPNNTTPSLICTKCFST